MFTSGRPSTNDRIVSLSMRGYDLVQPVSITNDGWC